MPYHCKDGVVYSLVLVYVGGHIYPVQLEVGYLGGVGRKLHKGTQFLQFVGSTEMDIVHVHVQVYGHSAAAALVHAPPVLERAAYKGV